MIKEQTDITSKCIPKVIHYCWFGRGKKTELACKCIESWKRKLPDYKIIEWNEENYPVHDKCEFVKDAYENKAYAYVSDYARFDILEKYGGFYLDVDVEVLKSFDDLRTEKCIMGFQDNEFVAPGLFMASVPHHSFMRDMLDYYNTNVSFYDKDGNKLLIPVPVHTNKVLTKYGLVCGGETQVLKDILILSKEYFSPVDCKTLKKRITNNTYSIHYYQGSWMSDGTLWETQTAR